MTSVISINGKTITTEGSSICVINNKVYVDGKLVDFDFSDKEIVIKGNVQNLKCDNSVRVEGDVGTVECAGSCHCVNVKGNIVANGSVHAGDVSGNINACGSVHVKNGR